MEENPLRVGWRDVYKLVRDTRTDLLTAVDGLESKVDGLERKVDHLSERVNELERSQQRLAGVRSAISDGRTAVLFIIAGLAFVMEVIRFLDSGI